MHTAPDVELLGPEPVGRFGSPLIWISAGIFMALLTLNAWLSGIGTPGNSLASLGVLLVLILAFAVLLQYLRLSGRDVVLSVEGVRKGKGSKSRFIPWRGATLYYDRKRDCYVVAAKGDRIRLKAGYFSDTDRFREIISYLEYVVEEQGMRRNAHAAKTSAPLHRLSETDRAAFLAYRGDGLFGFSAAPYVAMAVFIACATYLAFVLLLVAHPPLSGATLIAVNWILRTFPFLFFGWPGEMLPRFCAPIGLVAGMAVLPGVGRLRRIKVMRTTWLEQFDQSQALAISPVGLTFQTTEDAFFLTWNEILKISLTRELILFHLTPELTFSLVLPKRVFSTPADAEAYYRQAEAFRSAALTTPNIVEPVSFWEIA